MGLVELGAVLQTQVPRRIPVQKSLSHFSLEQSCSKPEGKLPAVVHRFTIPRAVFSVFGTGHLPLVRISVPHLWKDDRRYFYAHHIKYEDTCGEGRGGNQGQHTLLRYSAFISGVSAACENQETTASKRETPDVTNGAPNTGSGNDVLHGILQFASGFFIRDINWEA